VSAPTIQDAAAGYARRGWQPVPVDRKSRKALGKGWHKTPFSPHQFNGNAVNVGLQMGACSGGLCDVDLDAQVAIALAPEFLPPTDVVFGRKSKPCSHQLYVSDLHQTEKGARIAYQEYVGGKLGQMIVELRIGGGSKGAVTTAPPSMHVTGELVQWVNEGESARVPGTISSARCSPAAHRCDRHYAHRYQAACRCHHAAELDHPASAARLHRARTGDAAATRHAVPRDPRDRADPFPSPRGRPPRRSAAPATVITIWEINHDYECTSASV
jgi:hypothetical protein